MLLRVNIKCYKYIKQKKRVKIKDRFISVILGFFDSKCSTSLIGKTTDMNNQTFSK